MKNNDFIPSLRDESQDLPKQSKDSPSLAEGDTGGGLKAQNNSGVKFSNDKSTHPLTPSAREGVDLGLPSVRERGQVGKSHNDDKNYKRFAVCFVWSLFVACVISALLGILLYIYDPFMFFHKPYFREQTYMTDLRASARGIIDYAEFDSVILGSSMLENTSAREAEEKLGGKWVNLSMGGAHPNVRAVVLKYLLQTKPPKHILYSFDTHSMILDNPLPASIKPELYSDNFIAKLRFYMDKRFIKCALKWSKKSECVGNKELENIPVDFYRQCESEAGFLNWCQYDKVKTFLLKADEIYETQEFNGSIDKSQDLLKRYILDFVRKNPHTEFHFAISAYSTFYYRVQIDDGYVPNPKQHLDKWRKILKWLVNEAQNLPNMTIYGFDNLPITNDTRNYIDHGHYRIGYPLNSIALDSIRDRTHILTPQNIDTYLATMESKIKNYDIAPLIAEIKAWEAKQM